MTAGRGIVHSEMPLQESGRMAGFQLWVNLPAADKMCAPRYQDIPAAAVPVVIDADGASVKILAGSVGGATGPVSAVATEPTYLDVTLPANGRFSHAVPPGHTAFAYVFEGEVSFGEPATSVRETHLAVFSEGERIVAASGAVPGRFILLAGRPLKEPIVQYGPFVMNTADEIRHAISDFQAGRF
jgi:redox-sensitive bicupin YhaK (pirin superfamily)